MLKITKINELYHHIDSELSILKEINSYFSFRPEGYKYMTAYKNGQWDGFIRIFKINNQLLYSGLIPDLISFCNDRNYSYQFKDESINIEKELNEFLETIPSIFNFEPRDYQLEYVKQCLRLNKAIANSPTGSGKSAILYLYSRFILDKMNGNILIVVPTISLVTQMVNDFKSYCKDIDIESLIYPITAGVSKDKKLLKDKRIIISTWQSIYKQLKSFYSFLNTNNYPGHGALIIDECHLAESGSFTKIIDNCSDIVFKLGTTGSLKSGKLHELQLKGLIGSEIKLTNTKELMDSGLLSNLEIHNIILSYSKEEKELMFNNSDYFKEVNYVLSHIKRNNLITNIVLKESGNILVLFNMIDHGKLLFDLISKKLESNRKIYYIDGSSSLDEREQVRIIAEENDGIIIIASYGVFSTGVNIKRLHTVIFAHPFKSLVKNIQSIGRTLRLHESKSSAKLIDFCDDFVYEEKVNHLFRHSIERLKIYKEEQFNVKNIRVNI